MDSDEFQEENITDLDKYMQIKGKCRIMVVLQ